MPAVVQLLIMFSVHMSLHRCVYVLPSQQSQDSASRSSAARSRGIYTPLLASTGSRGGGGDPGCMAKARMWSLSHAHICIVLSYCIMIVWPSSCVCACQCRTTEARLFVVTGTPVQPHSSDGLEGLPADYRWVVIPPIIYKHFDLPENASNMHEFQRFFDIEEPEQDRRLVVC